MLSLIEVVYLVHVAISAKIALSIHESIVRGHVMGEVILMAVSTDDKVAVRFDIAPYLMKMAPLDYEKLMQEDLINSVSWLGQLVKSHKQLPQVEVLLSYLENNHYYDGNTGYSVSISDNAITDFITSNRPDLVSIGKSVSITISPEEYLSVLSGGYWSCILNELVGVRFSPSTIWISSNDKYKALEDCILCAAEVPRDGETNNFYDSG